MRINFNPNVSLQNNSKKQSFGVVNQSFLRWAKDDYERGSNIGCEWLHHFGDEIFVFEDVSKQDAKDTLAHVKRYVSKESLKVFKDFFKGVYA